jgi:hypothetical protein
VELLSRLERLGVDAALRLFSDQAAFNSSTAAGRNGMKRLRMTSTD